MQIDFIWIICRLFVLTIRLFDNLKRRSWFIILIFDCADYSAIIVSRLLLFWDFIARYEA